ncbi:hypothetical protein C9374_001168 [Naegleria lovaniensis]|uniref:Alpha-ketoglutarate-dependent dioxygenase AlkB-like domain-containing protein n=1 Tax=Naegleria lovaniensis TaxID=51637 RepID=A0AA88GXQ6_NAELO|nr:uncharacterized protein C9374_001168 [Naegleria lovaniensis]KAG2387574.1 hypothetical protein C9374_001168 [Naegleria lovaniensis]
MSSPSSSSSSNHVSEFVVPPHLVSKYYSTNPKVNTITGLYVFPNYLSQEEASNIMNNILDANEWCSGEICRRQQHYGYLYYHTRHHLPNLQPKKQEVSSLKSMDFDSFWSELFWEKMIKRDGLFNCDTSYHVWKENVESNHGNEHDENAKRAEPQCLVNEYMGNQGIASHVDNVNAFGDVIVGISLLNPVYMTFRKDKLETKILLPPNSCYVLTGESRFEWRHGITHMKQIYVPREYLVSEEEAITNSSDVEDEAEGKMFIREDNYRRISLTFRFIKIDGTKKVVGTEPKEEGAW